MGSSALPASTASSGNPARGLRDLRVPALAAFLVALDVVVLALLPARHLGAFVNAFEAFVALAGTIACGAAAARSRRFDRALWVLVSAFFTLMVLTDVHDLTVALGWTLPAALAPLAYVGWVQYLPLAMLIVLPVYDGHGASQWRLLSVLDLLQWMLVVVAAGYVSQYLPQAASGQPWTVHIAANDVRNLVLAAGLLARAHTDPSATARSVYRRVGGCFAGMTFLFVVFSSSAPVSLAGRPALLLTLGVLAWRWRPLRPESAATGWRRLASQWLLGVIPAGGPIFIAVLADSTSPRTTVEAVVVTVSVVLFVLRTGVAELGRLTAERHRRRAEAERQQLEQQLRASQKMEAVGRLAGGVAHDFNNLVSVILTCTDFALERAPQGDPIRDDLLDVQKAGERAATLTKQLLAFSRRQVLEPTLVDLNEVVRGVDVMLQRLAGVDIELVRRLAPDLHPVRADAGQVEQVLMNLVVNARDAIARVGTVTIETANVELDHDGAGRHGVVKPGPHVRLTVADTGCGMDEQTQARIFEPFFTTKERGRGTGLGLSTVYGIVTQSGGNILVKSVPGLGTRFEVCLPRASSGADAPRGAPPALDAAASAGDEARGVTAYRPSPTSSTQSCVSKNA